MLMLAWFLGSLAAKAADPVSWVVMAIALAMGLRRAAWYWPLLTAAIGAIVVTAIIVPQHRMLGLQRSADQVLFNQFFLIAILAMVVYGIARLIMRGRADGDGKPAPTGREPHQP